MSKTIGFLLTVAGISLAAATAQGQSGPYQYFAITPCRVVDTRWATGVNGGPILTATTRDFSIRGNCGIPLSAKAISANVTITNASTGSFMTIWPSGVAKPWVATLNFDQNSGALGNGILIGLSTNTNDLSVFNANGTVHVIIDVSGYFQ